MHPLHCERPPGLASECLLQPNYPTGALAFVRAPVPCGRATLSWPAEAANSRRRDHIVGKPSPKTHLINRFDDLVRDWR